MSKQDTLIAIYIILMLLDYSITGIGVRNNPNNEGNIILRILMQSIGIWPALILSTFIIFSLLIILKRIEHQTINKTKIPILIIAIIIRTWAISTWI